MPIIIEDNVATIEIQAKPMSGLQPENFPKLIDGFVPLDLAVRGDIVGVVLKVVFVAQHTTIFAVSNTAVAINEQGRPFYFNPSYAVRTMRPEALRSIIALEGDDDVQQMFREIADKCRDPNEHVSRFDCLISAHGMLIGSADTREHIKNGINNNMLYNAGGVVEACMQRPDSAHDFLERARNADALTLLANEFFSVDVTDDKWDDGVEVAISEDGSDAEFVDRIAWSVSQPSVQ
jgi:hypothetical protein